MLSEKLIDLKTFKSIYGYRVANILENAMIVEEKLIVRRDHWATFLALVRRLGMNEPQSAA
ncbi:hypothetical protein SAMN05216317_11350 [Nitrosomonas eutropha]|uniref:Uncharacterized protein n=1 Tax=Nitrosomonas eutropha TaxID=916 RepID=A0ABX5MA46_9PROT|nr:hypothetical protein C8R14_11548 [Nitrosomonas eutropha]SCX01468.1 hypothetical protein SAMN05216379_101204 [Nitrosomonas eutropha]SDW80607.1 hypothetical protein SAMN05216317_11350 [Nitrosomonas eutropha]